MRGSLAGLIRRAKNGVAKRLSRVFVPRRIRAFLPVSELSFLGTGDGKWPLLPKLLPARSTCYCVGVGVNASFDVGLAQLGHDVHSFDPTPRALAYAKEAHLTDAGITFHPIGIWNEAKTLRFYAPRNLSSVNFSVVDLHGTGEFIEAKCERLSTIMGRLGHSRIDVLKLDVEGSWGPIMEDLLKSKILPTQLCVEFDSPTSTRKIVTMVKHMHDAGYRVAWFERENFLLVRDRAHA